MFDRWKTHTGATERIIKIAVLAGGISMSCLAPPAARAQNTALSPDSLKSTLSGMGYQTEFTGRIVTVKLGDNFVVNFTLDTAHAEIYAFESYSVPADKANRAPMRDMLVYNDTHKTYFSLQLRDGKVSRILLNVSNPIKGLDPVALRGMIEDLKQADLEQQALFNPSGWK